jgi:glycosyltransferase involved in cell wall biosynthesis
MVCDAIQSVLDQTFADWEVIVVDDGSSDNTRQVIARYTDLRIHYIYQDNKGLPGARNTGIRNAQGQYIAFLDSDDLFLPNKLSAQAAALDARPALGLVGGGYFEVDRQLRVLRELRPWEKQPTLRFADWVMACPFCPSAPLVRREWLDKAGLFDENMRYIEDWDLWLRMSHLGCQMDWLKEPVCSYRIHGGNMVRHAVLMKNGMITMLDKLYADNDLPPGILALRGPAYGNIYLNAAARAFSASADNEGKDCLDNAFKHDLSLLNGNPPRFLSSLASFALSPLCNDADTFMYRLIGNLPESAGTLNWSKRKALSLLRATAAFDHYQHGEHKQAARKALSALALDPSWLRNRGLIAAAIHSLTIGLRSRRLAA